MKGLAAVRTQVGQVCAEKGASPNTNSAAGMANKISPSAAAVMAAWTEQEQSFCRLPQA